jgi:hypothetical protein
MGQSNLMTRTAGTGTFGPAGTVSRAGMDRHGAQQPVGLEPLVEALGRAVARRGLRAGVQDSPPLQPVP